MQHSFQYDKRKVLQALRYHFIQRPEIRVLIILVNVFAIVSAVLFYMQKIRPEPFLLGSLIWLLMVAAFWFILPNTIYRRSSTFKDRFIAFFGDQEMVLENERGYINWGWGKFSKWFESPHFFHLYFDDKSFFLVPKEGMNETFRHELRSLLRQKIDQKA
ncbi:MAG TPA: hypothetical protein DCO78_06925 [Chitinophagaceae bacterium]|nr:hypothetical protein [Chitinophagaceae bacterium]